MNKISILHILLLLGFQAVQIMAQEVMSLEKAISIALENNFKIKVDEQNIRIAENNNSWARAGMYPTVDLNGSFTNGLVDDNNPASFLQGTFLNSSLGASLDANWVAYGGGRVRIAKEQLDKIQDQQKLLQSNNRHSILKEVIQAYYAVLLEKEKLTVLEKQILLSNDKLEYEKVKKEFGNSNAFSIIQFEQAILGDSSLLIGQKSNIVFQKKNLYRLLNIPADSDYNFLDKISVVPEDLSIDKLQERLFASNYSLKTLSIIQELELLNTKLAKSNRKPTLSVNGSVGFSENYFKFYGDNPQTGEPAKGQFSNRINLGLNANLNWNLFDGGNKKTDIKNANINESIAALNFTEATVLLSNQLATLYDNYVFQKDLLKINESQITMLQRNLIMADEKFKLGQISSLDYRNIQIQLQNASINKVISIYNLLISKSEIDWLVGYFEK